MCAIVLCPSPASSQCGASVSIAQQGKVHARWKRFLRMRRGAVAMRQWHTTAYSCGVHSDSFDRLFMASAPFDSSETSSTMHV